MKNKWLKYIVDHPEIKWDWNAIATNPNIHIDDFLENPHLPWNINWLTRNRNITWALVEANPQIQWNYIALSWHPELSLDFVKAHPTYNWDWWYISAHKNITWEIVRANRLWNHPDKTKRRIPWSMVGLSKNPNVTMDIIEANITHSWSYGHALTQNPNLTWEFIKRHLDKPWDWDAISRLPIITWDIVVAHPEVKWSYRGLSANPNITMEIVSANRNKPWDSLVFSENKNVTIEIVKANRWFPWVRYGLVLLNPNITVKDYMENTDLNNVLGFNKKTIFEYANNNYHILKLTTEPEEFTWHDMITGVYSKYKLDDLVLHINKNPNISWEIVEAYPHLRWDYYILARNPMTEPVKKRVQARNAILKEEIVAAAWHPDRCERMAELYNMDVIDYMDCLDCDDDE